MSVNVERRTGELQTLLSELSDSYAHLERVLERQLEAMRRAEPAAMHALSDEAGRIASRIRERDGLRVQLMGVLGTGLGLEAEAARRMSLRELAERLGEPQRGALLVLAERLRVQALRVDRLNRIIALVSGEMLRHMRRVYEALSEGAEKPVTYSARGHSRPAAVSRVFEMVG